MQTTNIDRREFLKRSAITGTAAAGMGAWILETAGQPAEAATTGQVEWGALCLPPGKASQQSGVAALEAKVGRKFDTTHYRMPWTTDLVNSFTSWSASTGHTQILSWFARTQKGLVSWKGIAAGNQDAWITTQARALKAAGWKGFFCFHKEPEDEGSSTDWKGAYNRVHQIFDNVGVTGMKWVVCLMASTYLAGKADPWMPPNYDLLGVDGYNRYHCRGVAWRTFDKIFAPANSFAVAKNKSLYMIESGCVEGAPGAKAQWLNDARATIKTWPKVVGISYNHENTDCNYYVDSSSSSLAAFQAMGQDSYFI